MNPRPQDTDAVVYSTQYVEYVELFNAGKPLSNGRTSTTDKAVTLAKQFAMQVLPVCRGHGGGCFVRERLTERVSCK